MTVSFLKGFGLAILTLGALAGCTATTTPVTPCCYTGEVAVTRLDTLYLAMEDGTRQPFAEVFHDYQPAQGFITRTYPFIEADIAQVTYKRLKEVLPRYDANGNDILEEPELTVLYLQEAAKGLGHPVSHVGLNPPIAALAPARADVGGLVNFVERHLDAMTPEARAIFEELELVGRDIRSGGSEGPDSDTLIIN